MNYWDPMFLVSLAGGLAILFFGRKLFWLYVGLVGILLGFELVKAYLPQQPLWVALIAGIVLGAILAILAIATQFIAIGVAGLFGGAYLAMQILTLLPVTVAVQLQNWVLLLGGVLGALFCVLLFNPALIILSSLTGAAVLAQLFPIQPLFQTGLLFVIAVLGMSFQFTLYHRAKTK